MNFEPKPLIVECDQCKKKAETWDYMNPDLCLSCDCCLIDHDHTGLGCRSVTVYAHAHLTLFDINELMEMAAEREWDKRFENLEEVKN